MQAGSGVMQRIANKGFGNFDAIAAWMASSSGGKLRSDPMSSISCARSID
jgi:hypothetical protein